MNKEYNPWDYSHPAVSMLSSAFTLFVRAPLMGLGFVFCFINLMIFIYPLVMGKKILFHSQAMFLFYLFVWFLAVLVLVDSHGDDVLIDLFEYWYGLHLLWITALGSLIEYGVSHALSSWWVGAGVVVAGYAYINLALRAWVINYEFIKERNLNGLRGVLPISITNAILYFVMPTYYWRSIKAVFTTKSKGIFSFDDFEEIANKTFVQ